MTVTTMFNKKEGFNWEKATRTACIWYWWGCLFLFRGQRREFFVSSRVLKKLHFSVNSDCIQTGHDRSKNCSLQALLLSLRLGSSWACLESITFLMVRQWQVFCSLSCLVAKTKEVSGFSRYRGEPFTLCSSQSREIEPSPHTTKREILTLSNNFSR